MNLFNTSILPSEKEESIATNFALSNLLCEQTNDSRQEGFVLWPGRASIECIKYIYRVASAQPKQAWELAIRKRTDILPKKRKGNMNMPTL